MSKEKLSVLLVFTGDGKGKTSAGLGLLLRSLGAEKRTAFVQFIKSWNVSEHNFIEYLTTTKEYKKLLTFYRGGKGFYNIGTDSAKDVSDKEHRTAAHKTFDFALNAATSGKYDLVIADEINNAVHDGLLNVDDLRKLITARAENTSLCLTGRNFPRELADLADIITEMKEEKHHFRDGYLAQEGIDY